MKDVTDNFKNYISMYGREIDTRITLEDGTVLTGASSEDGQGIISLTRTFEADFFNTVMVQLEGELQGRFDLTNQMLKVEFAVSYNKSEKEWCEIGNFIVQKHTREVGESFDTTTFTAYDLMLKSHQHYEIEKLDIKYPISVYNLLKSITETIIGVELEPTKIVNGDLLINEDKWTPISEVLYRDVLDEIAKTCGGTIFISNSKMTVKYFDKAVDLSCLPIIDENKNFSLSLKKEYGPVNILSLTRATADNYIYPETFESIPEDERNEIVFEDIEIMSKDRELYAPGLFETIKGIRYYPFEAKTQGMIYLEPLDMVNVVDMNGVKHLSVVMCSDLKITSGIVEDIETLIPSNSRERYATSTDTRKQYLKVSLLVDQQNGKIEALVKEQTVMNKKLDSIETLTTQLTSNIPTTQVYDYETDLYTPDYTAQNLIITPLVKLGNKVINIEECEIKWYMNDQEVGEDKTFNISQNLNDYAVLCKCVVTWLEYESSTDIALLRVDNGKQGEDGKQGETGKGAYNVSILASASSFTSDDGGVLYLPEQIELAPSFQNCNYNVWQYSSDGLNWLSINAVDGLSVSDDVLTILNTSTLFNTRSSIHFRVMSDRVGIGNTITITKLEVIKELQDKLDNLQGNIDLATSSVSEISASLVVLNDSLSSTVVENWEGAFGDDYQALKKQISEVTQRVNEWNVEFNTFQEVVGKLGDSVASEISRYMRFNSNGQLIIGRSDSTYQVRISNDSFDILSGNNTVATFSESLLSTNNIRVQNTIQLGNIIMQSYTDGMVFKWGGS